MADDDGAERRRGSRARSWYVHVMEDGHGQMRNVQAGTEG